MPKQPIKLAVVWSGNPEQKPVNRQQVRDLKSALKSFKITKYDFNRGAQTQLLRDYKKGKVDIVLKNSYGRGHEADAESFLELHGIPFFGSGSQATLAGTSKQISKKLFKAHRLPVAKDVCIDQAFWRAEATAVLKRIAHKVRFPCIIKDVEGTDSRGIFIAHSMPECKKILIRSFRKQRAVIVEEYIADAYETTCFVAEREGVPYAYEPVGMNARGMLTANQKDAIAINCTVPAKLPLHVRRKIQKVSVRAHQALGCQTFSRADILVKGNRLYLLEVDVHPGFRKKSATTQSVSFAGDTLDSLFINWYREYV